MSLSEYETANLNVSNINFPFSGAKTHKIAISSGNISVDNGSGGNVNLSITGNIVSSQAISGSSVTASANASANNVVATTSVRTPILTSASSLDMTAASLTTLTQNIDAQGLQIRTTTPSTKPSVSIQSLTSTAAQIIGFNAYWNGTAYVKDLTTKFGYQILGQQSGVSPTDDTLLIRNVTLPTTFYDYIYFYQNNPPRFPNGLALSNAMVTTSGDMIFTPVGSNINCSDKNLTSVKTIKAVGNISTTANLVSSTGIFGNILQISTGNNTAGNVIQLGNISGVGISTTSPLAINMGASFSSASGVKPKLYLYSDGVLEYGLGVSSNAIDCMVPSGAGTNFWSGAIKTASVNGAGLFIRPNENPTSTTLSIGSNTAAVSMAAPAILSLGGTYASGTPSVSNLKLKILENTGIGATSRGFGTTISSLYSCVENTAGYDMYIGSGKPLSMVSGLISFANGSDTNFITKFTDSANTTITLQATLSGFHTINFNGAYSNLSGEIVYNLAKNRWRIVTDQRLTDDTFSIQSYIGGSSKIWVAANNTFTTGISLPQGVDAPTYYLGIERSTDYESQTYTIALCTFITVVPWISTTSPEDDTERTSSACRITRSGRMVTMTILADSPAKDTGAGVSYTVFANGTPPAGQTYSTIESTYPVIPVNFRPATSHFVSGSRISSVGVLEQVFFAITSTGVIYIAASRAGTAGVPQYKVTNMSFSWHIA